jgi:hypothetical protein
LPGLSFHHADTHKPAICLLVDNQHTHGFGFHSTSRAIMEEKIVASRADEG